MLRAPPVPGKRNRLPFPAGRDTINRSMNRYLKLLLAAGLLAAPFGTGCSDLTSSSGKSTVIFGRVVDPSGTGIREIQVAVVYDWSSQKPEVGPPGPVSLAPAPTAGVTLSPPYPNPALDLASRPVTIRVQTDRDTTAEVGIWLVGSGVPSELKQLLKGSLSGTRTWTWDGREDIGTLLPNGLYTVRVYVPPESDQPILERGILVNRAAPVVFVLAISDPEVLNAVTDTDGNYVIDDIPVGEPFTRTDNGGQVQGGALVSTGLALRFHDPDGYYADLSQSVFIGSGQQVDKTTVLQPVSPASASRLP
jgi:hypothetical protein